MPTNFEIPAIAATTSAPRAFAKRGNAWRTDPAVATSMTPAAPATSARVWTVGARCAAPGAMRDRRLGAMAGRVGPDADAIWARATSTPPSECAETVPSAVDSTRMSSLRNAGRKNVTASVRRRRTEESAK